MKVGVVDIREYNNWTIKLWTLNVEVMKITTNLSTGSHKFDYYLDWVFQKRGHLVVAFNYFIGTRKVAIRKKQTAKKHPPKRNTKTLLWTINQNQQKFLLVFFFFFSLSLNPLFFLFQFSWSEECFLRNKPPKKERKQNKKKIITIIVELYQKT